MLLFASRTYQSTFLSCRLLHRIYTLAAIFVSVIFTRSGGTSVRGAGVGSYAAHAASAASAEMPDLRVCNAYPYKFGMAVYHVPARGQSASEPQPLEVKLTGAIQYKDCETFKVGKVKGKPIAPGSQFSFRFPEGFEVGIFKLARVPASPLIQIVIHRYDDYTAAAAFTSHAFSGLHLPEVAVVNTYRGHRQGALILIEKKDHEVERMRLNTAVTVRPGDYDCVLKSGSVGDGIESERRDKLALRLKNEGMYTIMRVGVQALDGPSYKEELVMFPHNGYRNGARHSHSRVQGVVWSVALALLAQTISL